MLSVLSRIRRRVRVNSYFTFPFRYRAHLILLVAVAAVVAIAMYGSTVSVKSRELTVVRAEGRGKGIYNFRDGRELAVDYRGSERAVTALRNGQATAAAVAVADLDDNGTPDLISGYSTSGIGLVTVQQGNPEAYAPLDEAVYPKLQRGYNPEALLPGADAYEAPIAIEHLVAGNFSEDSQKDVLIASGNGGVYLLKGDGRGRLGSPEQVGVTGTITALAAGEFAAADGRTDVAVGLVGEDGSVVKLFDGKFSEPSAVVRLSAPATAITFGSLDDDPFIDMAVAAGNQVTIVHGTGRKQLTPVAARTERISLPYEARGIALGNFTWDRAGRDEIAVMAEDGSVHVLARGTLDTRPYTDADRPNRGRLRLRVSQRNVDIETLSGWTTSSAESWNQTSEIATGAVSPQLFYAAKISHGEMADLVVGGSDQALHLVHATDVNQKQSGESASATSGLTSVTLDAVAPVADAVVMPRKLNGEGGLVLLSKQSAAPAIVPLAVTATIDVDRTDDNAAASACTGAANDCSLRGAITNANSNVDLTVINVPANTYVLSIAGSGGCDGNAVGDLDINEDTNIVGAGSATTIIRQSASGVNGDRVMCLNVPLALDVNYQFSGVTITGGRDNNSGFGGGGIIGGEQGNTNQFTNVVISNNQASGGNIGGGGIQITGGDLTFTSCTIGGSSAPGADRTIVAQANSNATSGGGLFFTPSAPGHTASTGNLSTTGTTFSRNTAASLSEGGGGADVAIIALASPGGIGTGNATFTSSTQFNNNSANPANGGGLIVTSLPTTVSGASFTSNSAGAASGQGGGIYVGSSTLLLDGSVNATTFTGNTASANGGSSISVNNVTTVSGTLVSIGGDVVVNGQGTWTNNNGSTLAPTNFLMFGGTFNGNNSTMNVGGNLTMQPQSPFGVTFNAGTSTINLAGNFSWTAGGTTPVGSFNAGTGTFNFNGSGAQSISGTGTTFNNLTVNKSNTLTLNVTSPIAGNLNITAGTFDLLANSANRTAAGGTLTVSNGSTLRIGGTGSLPANFTTHSIGATSTIEFNGSNQNVPTPNSGQSYGNLIINGTGTKTLTGPISITTQLTLGASAFDVSAANNFAISIAGNWINNGGTFNPHAGTVTFNGAGNAQTIGGTASTQPFFNLTNNKTSNSTTVGGSTTTLNITGNMTLQLGFFNAGTATAITVAGNWTNNTGTGAAFVPGSSTVTFNSTTAGQTINGSAASQTFNNITVSKTGQTLSTGGSTTQLDVNTLNITAGTVTAPANLNLTGDFIQATGSTFTPGTGTITFTGGNVQLIDGTAFTRTFNNFTVSKSANNVSGFGSSTIMNLTGNVLLSGPGGFVANTITAINLPGNWTSNGGNFTPGSSTVTFNNTTAGQTIGGTAATQNFGSIAINKAAQTLIVGGSTTTLNLSGSFINTAGTFDVGTASTINVGVNWANSGTFLAGSGTIIFNGNNITQTISGTNTFNNITINHTGTGNVTAAGSTFNVNNLLRVQAGTFISSSNLNNVQIDSGATLQSDGGTMNVAGDWTNNGGTFTPNGGTVNFNGAGSQTIGGTGSSTFNNLTVSNANGISMDSDNTVNGVLALTAGDITVAATKVLTQPANASSTGTFDVIGSVKRTGFVSGGAPLTFGNPFNSIQINSGTAPADITVDLAKTTPPSPIGFPNAVERTYTITPNGGSGISATLRLHYLDSELNGNTEGAGLNLWQFVAPLWRPRTITNFDTTDNWVEKSGVTSFSPWTMNSTLAPTATNGTVSGTITNPDGSPVVGAVVRLTGAQNRKTITDANGVYRFNDVETSGFYTVVPSRANYSFNPAQRSFNQVGESTEASFSGTSGGDNENPLDTAEYFIRQQYVDLLGREPEEGGFNYWSDRILECGADARCVSARRRDVAAAFFVEQEFQQTGSFIYGMYKGALGRLPAYAEFATDRTGLVVGPQLDAMKQAYAEAFVGRAEFVSKYAANATADSFVDALLANVRQASGVDLTDQRAALINRYNAGNTRDQSRSFAVRELTESAAFRQTEYNAGFVLTEYFGYLRRDPDQGGYDFWLNVLDNREPGNFRGMVCAFITSTEYQQRFSSIVSRSDQECGQ